MGWVNTRMLPRFGILTINMFTVILYLASSCCTLLFMALRLPFMHFQLKNLPGWYGQPPMEKFPNTLPGVGEQDFFIILYKKINENLTFLLLKHLK